MKTLEQTKLTPYETHKLIKAAIPEAKTVYERTHKGQWTIEEYLDEQRNQFNINNLFLEGL